MSDIGQREIFKHVKATAQPSLSMGTIRDIDIPFPPLKEQNRIVKKIDELMELFDNLHSSVINAIDQKEKLLQVTLTETLSNGIMS